MRGKSARKRAAGRVRASIRARSPLVIIRRRARAGGVFALMSAREVVEGSIGGFFFRIGYFYWCRGFELALCPGMHNSFRCGGDAMVWEKFRCRVSWEVDENLSL